jgi:epoxyqueuosine reductase
MLRNIGKIAKELGIILLGVSSPESLKKEEGRLKTWLRNGYGGEMAYLSKPNLCNPKALLSEVKSIISFAVPYKKRDRVYKKGYGQVARYAFGEDYHRVLPRIAKQLMEKLGISGRVFSDSVPLLERPLAESAGLGFIGKNTLLIRPGVGSYFLLGEILTDEELPVTKSSFRGCGTCKRCLTACPTGAIVEPYQLDARRCISYLTIEKRGFLSEQERSMIGEWIFGCDICQEVCPFNHGDGDDLASIKLENVLSIRSNREFDEKYGVTAFSRARRSGLLRNSLYVAVNQGYDAILPIVESLAEFDESPIVRLSAVWAARELGSSLWVSFLEKAKKDEKVSAFIPSSGLLGQS